MARIRPEWNSRRRRALRLFTSATIAAGLCLAGVVSSGPLPMDDSESNRIAAEDVAAADSSINPATGTEDLLQSGQSPSEFAPRANQSAAAPIAPQPAKTTAPASSDASFSTNAAATDSAEIITEAFEDEQLHDALWYDDSTQEAQLLIRFADQGVAPHAVGDVDAAVASLQENSKNVLETARPAINALVDSGDIKVLNEFWLTTSILVEAVPTEETLAALAALPGATHVMPNYEVTALDTEEPIVEGPPVEDPEEYVDRNGNPVTYGLDHISAPDAWADYQAYGQGVRVAVLDTGIDPNHPDLADRLVTEDPSDPLFPGGWIHLDYQGNPQAKRPADPATHGTHVSGTVLGGDASGTNIGVAPQAQLMAVNTISDGSGSAKILKSLEWTLDPYDAYGEPAGRPADVINMSLGSADPNFEDIYLFEAIQRVRDAGIFPAIASGNDMVEGSECISNPSSSYDAFAVGMTTEDKSVNSRSCGGTTNWSGDIVTKFSWPTGSFVKPDAAAPGTNVYSAVPSGGWGNSTGTSMATPHVAGAVAVLRSAQPGLTVDEIEHALEATAWHPNKTEPTDFSPDTRYGHGLIDVSEAIAFLQDEAGFDAVILNEEGEPLPEVLVSWADLASDDNQRLDPSYGETWVSDDNGRVKSNLRPGQYRLHFERFGYEDHAVEVEIPETGYAQVNVQMQAMTTGSVTGTVTNEMGEPLEKVLVSLVGSDISSVTDAQGQYTLEKVPVTPEGSKGHRLRASGENLYTVTSDDVAVSAGATSTVTFTMVELPSVAVVGSATPRLAELLSTQDLVVEDIPQLPLELNNLTTHDVIIWDDPGLVSAQTLQEFVELTDASGTGIIWLDLGATDTSGIAQLNAHFADPELRTSQNDLEENKAIATGYRIYDGAGNHEIFASGDIYTGALLDGSKIIQDNRDNTTKFWAAFESLSSESAQKLALAYSTELTTSGNPHDIDRGTGIAVDERDSNRHAYLSLHGAHTSVDINTWSAAGKQVLVNAVNWVAQADQTDGPPPPPDVEEPDPSPEPDPDPTDEPTGEPGGNAGSGGTKPTPSSKPTPNRPSGTTRPPASNATDVGSTGIAQVPAAASAPSQPATSGSAPTRQNSASPSNASSVSRAPASQSIPKPLFIPDPPVGDIEGLSTENSGGITLEVIDGIGHFTIPDSQVGEWYFLHVYPSKTPVDWIRVNSEGKLRADLSTLTDGNYKFSFINATGQLVGWAELVVGDGTVEEQAQEEVIVDSPTVLPPIEPESDFALSTLDLVMLGGAAVLLLSAATLMLLSLRKKDEVGAAA